MNRTLVIVAAALASVTWCLTTSASMQAGARAGAAAGRCGALLSDADAAKATRSPGTKLLREGTPRADALSCGYVGDHAFTFQVVTGDRGKTLCNGYHAAMLSGKAKIEAVTGIGKRAWYDPRSAMVCVDAGESAVTIVMGGKEGNPSVKGWLESIARIVVSHL